MAEIVRDHVNGRKAVTGGFVIGETFYEYQDVPGAWQVTRKECNGVRQTVARPVRQVVEVGPAPAWMLVPPDAVDPERDVELQEERRKEQAEKNAKRAVSRCRWFIIQNNFTEMLTLTYRENQRDERLFKKHWAAWLRRMRKALGGEFDFCAGFERQDRGAWHAHIACHKLPAHPKYKGLTVKAWELGTRIWRDVVGEWGGLCFVGGRPSKWGTKRRKNMSLYKLANYVSCYILKHFQDFPDGKNRYSRSNGDVDIERQEFRFNGVASIAELIAAVFELLPGEKVVSHRVGRLQDFYLLVTERSSRSSVLHEHFQR